MHGIIFAELQRYVTARLGPDAWNGLLKEAGTSTSLYLPIDEYPDADAVALVTTASRLTGKPAEAILEDFGEFIVPRLVKTYGSLIRPEWKTADLLANTEETIHRVVRTRNRGARPPELKVTRGGPGEVTILYASARRMCALAKGIICGVAKMYKENASISELRCMLRGDAVCELRVTTSPGN